MSKCEICGKGPFDAQPTNLYRQNALGVVPAVWRCAEHATAEIADDVADIVRTIEGPPGEPTYDDVIRAQVLQTLEAEIEKLPRWRISDVEWVQVADVLRLLAARGAQR